MGILKATNNNLELFNRTICNPSIGPHDFINFFDQVKVKVSAEPCMSKAYRLNAIFKISVFIIVNIDINIRLHD